MPPRPTSGGSCTYAQAATRDGQFAVARGFQSASSVTGESLTTRGFSTRYYAYFGEGEWWPNFLDGGITASVPQQPTNSQGVSFNGVQKIGAKWGLFLRANGASGTAVPIETSIAWGGVYDNPLDRDKLDQVGLGLFWDKPI